MVTIYALSHINTGVPYVTSELSVQKNAPVGDSSERLPAAGEVCGKEAPVELTDFRSQGGGPGGGIFCLHYRRVAGAWLSRVNGWRDIHAGIQDRVLGFWHEVARLVWARKHGHWKRLRPSMSSDSLDSLVTKQQIMPHD